MTEEDREFEAGGSTPPGDAAVTTASGGEPTLAQIRALPLYEGPPPDGPWERVMFVRGVCDALVERNGGVYRITVFASDFQEVTYRRIADEAVPTAWAPEIQGMADIFDASPEQILAMAPRIRSIVRRSAGLQVVLTAAVGRLYRGWDALGDERPEGRKQDWIAEEMGVSGGWARVGARLDAIREIREGKGASPWPEEWYGITPETLRRGGPNSLLSEEEYRLGLRVRPDVIDADEPPGEPQEAAGPPEGAEDAPAVAEAVEAVTRLASEAAREPGIAAPVVRRMAETIRALAPSLRSASAREREELLDLLEAAMVALEAEEVDEELPPEPDDGIEPGDVIDLFGAGSQVEAQVAPPDSSPEELAAMRREVVDVLRSTAAPKVRPSELTEWLGLEEVEILLEVLEELGTPVPEGRAWIDVQATLNAIDPLRSDIRAVVEGTRRDRRHRLDDWAVAKRLGRLAEVEEISAAMRGMGVGRFFQGRGRHP